MRLALQASPPSAPPELAPAPALLAPLALQGLPPQPVIGSSRGWVNPKPKVRVLQPASGHARQIVFLLHGLSHNAAAILRAEGNFIRSLLPDALIVAPDGYYLANPNQVLRARVRNLRPNPRSLAWFDLPSSRDRPDTELAESMRPSIDYVHGLIDAALNKTGMDISQVYLAGFSQGGAIACQVALERHKPCAGVAAINSPFFDPVIFGMTQPNSRPRIFHSSDLGDEIIPKGLTWHNYHALRRLGLDVYVSLTQAGPARRMTCYDERGRAYLKKITQPGAPVFETRLDYDRDEQGCLRQTRTLEVTGHALNDHARDCLIYLLRCKNEIPTVDNPALRQRGRSQFLHINEMAIPRLSMDILCRFWRLTPPSWSSEQPHIHHPLTPWNQIAYYAKHPARLTVRAALDMMMTTAPSALFTLPERVADQFYGHRRQTPPLSRREVAEFLGLPYKPTLMERFKLHLPTGRNNPTNS